MADVNGVYFYGSLVSALSRGNYNVIDLLLNPKFSRP